MLLTVFYIINHVPQSAALLKSKSRSVFVLKIAEQHYDELSLFYQSAENGATFCFCLNPVQAYSDRFINLLESFLYLPSYHKKHGKPLIFLENTVFNEQIHESIQSLLKEGLILYNHINISENQATHQIAYQNKVFNDVNETDSFFTELKNAEDIVNIDAELGEIDMEIRTNSEQIYNWKMKVKTLQNEKDATQTRLSAATQEIENLHTYLDIIRSNSQAKELQEYYNKEYEILPKWYKQFGHLLKVVIGKRTFRSLFSNRVKKYKD